jgi:hypothetical protein
MEHDESWKDVKNIKDDIDASGTMYYPDRPFIFDGHLLWFYIGEYMFRIKALHADSFLTQKIFVISG